MVHQWYGCILQELNRKAQEMLNAQKITKEQYYLILQKNAKEQYYLILQENHKQTKCFDCLEKRGAK